jgi:hypothetical protein
LDFISKQVVTELLFLCAAQFSAIHELAFPN